MKPQTHTESRDVRTYLRSLWRWKFLVLGLLLVVPAISYALEARKVPLYESSALVRPQAESDPSLSAAAPTSGDSIFAVARLVQTRTIAAAAGRLMRPPEAGSAVSGLISVSPDTETEFLTISATSRDPQRSADVANAFAQAISANRTATRVSELARIIKGFKRQLDALPSPAGGAATPDPQRAQLTEQIANLRSARNALRPNQGIVETAIPSSIPVGRSTRRAIELGIVIALLLSAGAIALAEGSDRRIRDPEDLERLTGLPLLAAIPGSAFTSDADEERDEEAFQMLRAALTYFNLDQSLSSVVIASAGQEDGKTTVAIRLAYAMARSGSDVILVDADMRHPRIATRLGLPRTEGLGSVLVGVRDLGQALIRMPIRLQEGPDMGVHGSLKLLPAGVAAPNAAELLSSPMLKSVVLSLEQQADLVIVDSAAALAVSDTLPLLQLASGVVLVARMNRSTRAEVQRLQQVTTAARGTVLGVVATGASNRGGSGYGYGYAPAPKPRGRWRPRRRNADGAAAKHPSAEARPPSSAPGEPSAAERGTARPASSANGREPAEETAADGPRRTASDRGPESPSQETDTRTDDRQPESPTRSAAPRGAAFDDLFEP